MRRLLVVPLVVAVAAAGCGGGTKDDSESREQYVKDLQQTSQTLEKTFDDIAGQAGSSPTLAVAGQRLDKGADAIDDAADRFAAIDPPDAAEAAHKKLVDGLHELAGVFRRGAQAARRNDEAGVQKVLEDLADSPGAKKITEAQQELAAAGITTTPAPATTTAGG